MLTTRAAAALLGFTPRHTRLLCEKGTIPGALRHGRDWAIPREAVERLMEERAGRPRGRGPAVGAGERKK